MSAAPAKRSRVFTEITNLLGGFGYFSVSLQWLFIALLYFQAFYGILPPIAQAPPPPPPEEPVVVVTSEGPSPLIIGFGIVVTIVMIGLSIYAFIKMPKELVKAGHKTTQAVAHKATPVILKAQGRKDTVRNRRRVTPRIVIVAKLLLIALPIIAAWASQFIPEPALDIALAMVIAFWLASWSVALFGLQYLLVVLFKIKLEAIR